MAYVSLFLPTATGDFSSAAAVFFDLPCACIILDPKGCTMDYLEVEDPRLPEPYPGVRSARMDDVDVTLCDCARLRTVARDAIEQNRPEFLVLIGSTVSSIIGMDAELFAQELEEELGLPVLGVNTDGFATYAQGIHLALKALIQRFGQAAQHARKAVPAVNVLGMTPLDFKSSQDVDAIRQAVEACGYAVNGTFAFDFTLDDVRRAPQAQLNLAVSSAGRQTALWMQQEYGIPFATCCPITEDDPQLPAALQQALGAAPPAAAADTAAVDPDPAAAAGSDPAGRPDPDPAAAADPAPTLIVGDAVFATSLRRWLHGRGYPGRIDVASFFRTADPLEHVIYLQGDLQLMELMEQHGYAHVIGDPLIKRLPGMEEIRFTAIPHPPLSSLLQRDQMPVIGADDPLFEGILHG